MTAISWDDARAAMHAAAEPTDAVDVPLTDAEGATLATDLVTLADLPAFPTSTVDGYAVRGAGPWRLVGRVLAGHAPDPLAGDGTGVEIATGAMVPEGTEVVLRLENCTRDGDTVDGKAAHQREWRDTGEEAAAGEQLLPTGSVVTPAVLGLAASAGYDVLTVRRRPRVALRVFGDELLTAGPPQGGKVRDSLGVSLPWWVRRLGADIDTTEFGPVEDTLDAHVAAMSEAAETADLLLTTGGTMHGPVDHLHRALDALKAELVVDTVAVRPGFPMLAARLPRDRWLVGLPGNPQSAVVGLVTLAAPLLAGLRGAPLPSLSRVVLGDAVPGRGGYTHLALVRLDADGTAQPLRHVGSAMLRGVARADGFAVVRTGVPSSQGDIVDFVSLPLLQGERP